jgi:hypothetical protein
MSKTAQVFTNDARQPQLKLVISGKVEKIVTIIPRTVNLRGFVGDTIKKSVTIIPEKKYDFKITGTRVRHGKYINFQLEEVKGTERTEYALTIENLRTDPGRYSDIIFLETDSEFSSDVSVRVYGNLRQRPAEE